MWIERKRAPGDNLPEGFPDQRAAAPAELVVINLGDIVRALAARSACIQEMPNRLLQACHLPTLERRGDAQRERFFYALNGARPEGGLEPGSQLDVSFLVRIHPHFGLDFLGRPPFQVAGPSPLEADGVFAGTGVMEPAGDPRIKEAALAIAGAGDLSRVVDPSMPPGFGAPFAGGARVNFFLSGGLRALDAFAETSSPGTLGHHGGGNERRVLVDGLDALDVRPVNLRNDRDRSFSRDRLNARNRPAGQLFRFTISIACLPLTMWLGGAIDEVPAIRYRYSCMTSVRFIEMDPAAQGLFAVRSHLYTPTDYFRPARDEGAQVQGPEIIENNQLATHWQTEEGRFVLVVGAFSHRRPGGPYSRFVLESLHARLYFRGLPAAVADFRGGRFIDPDVGEGLERLDM